LDAAIVSALSAVPGSVVGGAASIITTLSSQNTQSRRELMQADIKQREIFYANFVSTCCKLVIDSSQHHVENPETMPPAYELLNQIRLFSSDAVLTAAEQTIQNIFDQYFSANLTPEQLHELARTGKGDIVRSLFQRGLPPRIEDSAHSSLTLLPCARHCAAMQHTRLTGVCRAVLGATELIWRRCHHAA
jgi:hypothetical protein